MIKTKNIYLSLSKAFLYLAVFLIPFYIFRTNFGLLRTNVFEIAVFLSSAFAFAFFIKETIKPNLGYRIVYVFLALAFLSVFWSPDLERALGIFKGWFLVPVVFYLLLINFIAKEELKKVSLTLFCSLAVVAVWAILQRFFSLATLFYQNGDPAFDQYLLQNRAFGPFESPNYLAMFIVPALFISLYAFSLIKKRPLLILLFLTIPIALYLSGSRAGLLAFLVATFYGAVLYCRKFIRKSTIFTIFIATLTLGLLFAGIVFFSRGDFSSGGDVVRRQIYDYAFSMVKDSPVIGIGLGGFEKEVAILSAGDSSFITYGLPYALHPHNIYLAMWLNIGLLGFLSFIYLLFTFAKAGFKKLEFNYLPLAALIAILVHGIFDATYFKNDLSAIFWLVLSFLVIVKDDDK